MPLKSLISDQIRKLEDFGLHGVDISGGMTDCIREGISSANYSHIFASPESLLEEDGREMFALMKDRLWICGLFIDESHCVSKWGSSSGDTKAFRSAYGKLGEVRSKLRSGVAAVALTATATQEVRCAIIDSIGMKNYVWINASPDKMNIKHVVMKSHSRDYDSLFKKLVLDVRSKGSSCDRTIIYCQSRKTCSEVYATFLALLPKDHHAYVNMFHTNTENQVQQKIIKDMATPTGEVRILIATIAYGMGVDASSVHNTILCGRPSSLDDYIQMSGRIGRDGKQSVAVTVCYPGDTSGRVTSPSMKEFISGQSCRRRVIREVFGASSEANMVDAHNCCDVCTQSCDCGCGGNKLHDFERDMQGALEQSTSEEYPLNIPTPKQVDNLECALEEYRIGLLAAEPDFIYCGPDIACGLSNTIVEKIVKESNVEMDYSAFLRRYGFPSRKIATDVWSIVCDALGRNKGAVSAELVVDTIYEEDEFEDCSELLDDEYEQPVLVSDSD